MHVEERRQNRPDDGAVMDADDAEGKWGTNDQMVS